MYFNKLRYIGIFNAIFVDDWIYMGGGEDSDQIVFSVFTCSKVEKKESRTQFFFEVDL